MVILFIDETRIESININNFLNWFLETGNLLFPRTFLETYMHEGQQYQLPKFMTIDYYSSLDEDIRYLVDTICPFKEMVLI